MTIKEASEKCQISQDTLRYYERMGVIPQIKRTAGGMRDYEEADLKWIMNAKCMRKAGLPVEVIAECVRLYKEGDTTIAERLKLLTKQREVLNLQKAQIEETLSLLNYKIDIYENAVKTGKLNW